MPSKSKAQHNLMAMVANDPAAAKRLGIPSKVGKEFMDADKGRKFSKGGDMKKMSKGGSAKPSAMGKVVAGGKRPHGEHTIQEKGHTRAMMPKMAGSTTGMKKGGMAKKK
jgi:hypothetical protein